MPQKNNKESKYTQEPQNNKTRNWIIYIILFALYVIVSVLVISFSRSQVMFRMFGYEIPAASFTGVFSSMANMMLIFMVVFLGKLGFITAFSMFVLQFPLLLISILARHATTSIPGLFTNFVTLFAIILIYQRNIDIKKYQESEIRDLTERQMLSQRLFEQTATALVNAIDAKDTYSHGHSRRVAQYAKLIAKEMGKSEEECTKIYFAGLLHDVGKIGIPLAIINKNGRLTDEEYEVIKHHSSMGNQILNSISEYPYLSIAAHFHHERYDGKGYPTGLKGDDIPEIARIISVADAYDAMSSKRSYRDVLPQQVIREEIVKNSGTQFDPKIAKVMQNLIDNDADYEMREQTEVRELAGNNELQCGAFLEAVSDGIIILPFMTKIHLNYTKAEDAAAQDRGPAIVLFDSMDGRVHDEASIIRDLNYLEYGVIWMDGVVEGKNVRKTEKNFIIKDKSGQGSDKNRDNEAVKQDKNIRSYDVEAVKQKDHLLIRIDDGRKITEVTLALPDSSRFAYLSLTGEHCHISDVSISKEKEPVPANYIKRIAEPVSYLDGPEGDIPSVQVDGFRADASKGLPVTDHMMIFFHTKSLPIARMVWHCPYVSIYASDDDKIRGENYREYALIRLDGESWESEGVADNALSVTKTENFGGWDAWKKANKEGYDCQVKIRREGNVIAVTTENAGLLIKNTTTILDGTEQVLVALTGDQVALTNIRIQK